MRNWEFGIRKWEHEFQISDSEFQITAHLDSVIRLKEKCHGVDVCVTAVTQQSGPSFGLATAITLPRIVAFSAHYVSNVRHLELGIWNSFSIPNARFLIRNSEFV